MAKKSAGLKFTFDENSLTTLENMTEEGHFASPGRRGGLREPKGGRPPKPKAEKYRRRLITLPPETDAWLIKWSDNTGCDISALINRLVIDFSKEAPY